MRGSVPRGEVFEQIAASDRRSVFPPPGAVGRSHKAKGGAKAASAALPAGRQAQRGGRLSPPPTIRINAGSIVIPGKGRTDLNLCGFLTIISQSPSGVHRDVYP